MSQPRFTNDALYAAAVGLAIRSGSLKRKAEASPEHSHSSSCSYALIATDGRLIERFSLQKVQAWASERDKVLNRIEGRRKLQGLPIEQRLARFRSWPEPQRALAWAVSSGQPIPPGRFGAGELLTAVLLLALFVLPGVVFLIWAVPRGRSYRQALAILVRQWRASGEPDPVDAAFRRLVSR
ncbi:hypothetical protein I1E95_11600 [Synechococcus sp. CBW1107]|uniref:hypothetical protein n=1 Tax=Synechococcus sp. CBW1107 TaxID=2789857 RepID=UPI0018CF7787|nr:hypothetical protein [Synechococcus sp. CBW1107]QPN55799.1 hypothetical protein I1E95_11600 [Synechococcus sp. CBW1107]